MPETPDAGDPRPTTEQKLDALSASVDKRFDAVDEAFVEQRQYTEFAFDKLAGEMKARFDEVNKRFDKVDGKLEKVNGRFDTIDGRFNGLERKLDQFIDTQAKTNELVERRLQALEPPKRRLNR
jgi:hypothetical protein